MALITCTNCNSLIFKSPSESSWSKQTLNKILTASKFRGDTPWLILGREVELLITFIHTNHLGDVSTNLLNNINQVSDRNSTFAKKKEKSKTLRTRVLCMYHGRFLFSKFRKFRDNINETLREDFLHISSAFTFFGNIEICSFSIHIAFISQN